MNPEDGYSLQEISSDTNLTVDQSADEVTLSAVCISPIVCSLASKLVSELSLLVHSRNEDWHLSKQDETATGGASASKLPTSPAKMSPSHPGHYRIRELGQRGLGVVLCNIKFSHPLKTRISAVADRDNMSLLFQTMGLLVKTYSDLNGQELKQLISEYSRKDLSQFDCFFMAVSSHGDRGSVLGTDGVSVPIESHILTPFNGANCPSLISKPKVFFLQACRGNEKDFCVKIPDNQTDGNAATEQATRLIEKIRHLFGSDVAKKVTVVPTELDFFVAYSTVPGYVSWRNTEKGSWFLYALCECYYLYGNEVHLADLMTYVTDYVARYFSDIDEETKRIAKQVICYECRLSKFLIVPVDRK